MYLIKIIENSFVIVIYRIETALQEPISFFLGKFSSLEFCYVPIVLLRIMSIIGTQDWSFSVMNCATEFNSTLFWESLDVVHEGDWSVVPFLGCVFVWFGYQGNCSLVKKEFGNDPSAFIVWKNLHVLSLAFG